MLKVKVEQGNRLRFVDPRSDTGVTVTFFRTLRIPDDGKSYPLPPGMGSFPLRRVLDYKDRVPASWVKTSGVFLPMYQREAMWIRFDARGWRPNAVKVAAGKINALSGKEWHQKLAPPSREGGEELQDYMVCPPQPWLDGFNTGKGTIRQFIAMPLGMGYTVEGQVTGKEEHGGVQLIVFEPKKGRFPEQPPPPPPRTMAGTFSAPGAAPGAPPPPCAAPAPQAAGAEMGLGAGGTITQKIYPDPHGIETWDEDNHGRVFVHIVNSMMYREITGEAPPPTPVTAKEYTKLGYPWFELYDEGAGDIGPSEVLSEVKPVTQMDATHGFVGVQDDGSVEVPDEQVKGIPRDEVPDGDW
jgi:hypothetical protein